jgi:hypothetical protein
MSHLHLNNKILKIYYSPKVIRMITSRRIRWAGHATRTGRRGFYIGFLWESQKERYWSEDETYYEFIISTFYRMCENSQLG